MIATIAMSISAVMPAYLRFNLSGNRVELVCERGAALVRRVIVAALAPFVFVGALAALSAAPVAGSDRDERRGLDDRVRRGIVLVEVSGISTDPLRPWIREPRAKYQVHGLVLDGGRILVAAGDVRGAALVEVRRFSSYNKVPASVEVIDLESNMAMLRVTDAEFLEPLRPLPLGRDPVPGDRLTVVHLDELFRVYREPTTIGSVDAAADYGFTVLPIVRFSVSSAIRGGGLLMGPGGLSGFLSYGDGTNRIEATPASSVKAFSSANSGSVFCTGGLEWSSLEDPVLRSHYGLTEGQGGVLVVRVFPGASAYGQLRASDVVLSIDGAPLDARGLYQDPLWGPQDGALLFARAADGRFRAPNDKVRLSIVRERKVQTLDLTLLPFQGGAERIPWLLATPPGYLVEGGYIFLELSVPLLQRRFGETWRTSGGEAAYLYQTQRYRRGPSDDRIVVLSEVLPDATTRGNESVAFRIVKSVDGKPVPGIVALREHLSLRQKSGERWSRVELTGGLPVFLSLANRDQVLARVLKRYGIPASFERPGGDANHSKK